MAVVRLKKKREDSLLRRHPWIFSGAVASVEGRPGAGETVAVCKDSGERLGWGAYSPDSQIRVRMWTFDPEETVDAGFFHRRIVRAMDHRRGLFPESGPMGVRLVHGESDGLPGVVIDRYADVIVCQFLSTGGEYWKHEIVSQLVTRIPSASVFERSDASVRVKEGLAPVSGRLWGEEPPRLIEIREGPCRFLVDVREGHKTGFYLDQRINRARVAEHASGKSVLNCFSYTGGFGIAALKAGASAVTHLDASAPALALAEETVRINGGSPFPMSFERGDAFDMLRRYQKEGRTFDMIVLDPPKFAESRAQLMRAARAYKDINLQAFRILPPGGILATFSCSGMMSPDLFQKVVADAALDAGREGRILSRLFQAPDHPTALNFPEGAYLKGLIIRAS